MEITLKLYATLTPYLPENATKNIVSWQIEEGDTAETIVGRLHLPRELVHLVLLNGVYVAPDSLNQAVLSEGDTLAIWPPVAGG